jgi:hypothetical protein
MKQEIELAAPANTPDLGIETVGSGRSKRLERRSSSGAGFLRVAG